jgi:hypothetical protein
MDYITEKMVFYHLFIHLIHKFFEKIIFFSV